MYDTLNIQVKPYSMFGHEAPWAANWASNFALLMLNLDLAYQAICDGLEIKRHHIYIEKCQYPNMSLSLKGLGEPIKALHDILKTTPLMIASLANISGLIQQKRKELEIENVKLDINLELMTVLRETVRTWKFTSEEDRSDMLQEIVRSSIADLPMETLTRTARSTMFEIALQHASEEAAEGEVSATPPAGTAAQ